MILVAWCEEVAGRSHASIGILDAGFSCFYYFIGFAERSHAAIGILDAGFSCFCYFIGSISGRKAWRCILVREGPGWILDSRGLVGKVFGMGMLLSMDSCPCELSRAGRSLGIYTVATWRFCNFVHSFPSLCSIPNRRALACCFVLSFRCDHLDLVYLPSPYTRPLNLS